NYSYFQIAHRLAIEILKTSRIYLPRSVNAITIVKLAIVALRKMLFTSLEHRSCVRVRNTGITEKGFIIASSCTKYIIKVMTISTNKHTHLLKAYLQTPLY
ncbi:MAG: hypothetical protein LM567_03195, partial [Desulfurococcaceae archaeon]|nr:hypothetical protein [Desulfurococcaceae archaeon]